MKTVLYRLASAGKLNNTGGLFKKCARETFETVKPRNFETPKAERKLVDLTSGKEYARPCPETFQKQKFQRARVSQFHTFQTGWFDRANA